VHGSVVHAGIGGSVGWLAGPSDVPMVPSPRVINSICIYIYTHTHTLFITLGDGSMDPSPRLANLLS
jgi:hypothetical protein